MKKINILLFVLMLAFGGFAQHCADSLDYIIPYPGSTAGLTPEPDALPCHMSGDTYYDTLYFHNFTNISGLGVNYIKIDSIENLPNGLCWSTNKGNNTFLGGEDGTILIKGTSSALAGQYKLRIIVDLNAGPGGGVNIQQTNADAFGLKYYLKVACNNGVCLPVGADTVSAFVPYTANCTMGTVPVTASISASGATTFCQGGSVTLTANSGLNYTYLWSNGSTAQSIVDSAAATYTVTVYNATDSAVSSPVTVTIVTTCQNSGATGFSPSSDQLPCIVRGQAVNDTLYFINYSLLSGLNVNSLKFDSIANLPSGLTWSTNKPNNTFLGGDSGFVVIQGTTTDSSGQYKLRMTIDMTAGGGTVFTNVNAESLLALRYYVRVACASGGCLAIDTVQGQYNQFVPYTAGCTVGVVPPVATITASGPTTFCYGNTVTLTANINPTYSYLWSNGATAQFITVDTTGAYYVTVTNSAGSAVAGPISVVATNCQYSGVPGFYPPSDQIPCMVDAQFVSDTIYFKNYGSINGLSMNSLKIDSIENLPAGLSWITNKSSNTFLASDSGYIEISGFVGSTVPAGQYKLRVVVNANLGPNGTINLTAINLEQLSGDKYFLRVACSAGGCQNVDTSAGAFVADSNCSTTPIGSFSPSVPTSVCGGQSVLLTANSGITSGYSYLWSTGATTQSIAATISGFYHVTVTDSVGASIVQNSPYIVVSPPVVAYFTIQPDPNTAHLWYAVNQCTGNQLSYIWNWGDSSTSTGATPSHTYTTAGYYNVCVTVSDSMGCGAYYCDTNVYLFKTDNQMIQMNVVQYATGINDISAHAPEVKYYANAIHFSEAIVAPADVKLYDLSGRVVMAQEKYTGSIMDVSTSIASGVYILHMQNNSFNSSQKLMIIK